MAKYGRAKILTNEQLDRLLDDIARDSRNPERDFVVILLSHKAGLRACEIAGLTWRDVTNASGELSDTIEVPSSIAKMNHARSIPMHPMLKEALSLLRSQMLRWRMGVHGKARVVRGPNGKNMNANSLQSFMGRLYKRHGLDASSHSGRRGLLTKLARVANAEGCSLFDVQAIAGHNHISSTEAYVDHSDRVIEMMRRI